MIEAVGSTAPRVADRSLTVEWPAASDAVFAALGRIYGRGARGPITNLTLFGGFASTLCWPLSAFMIEQTNWRTACFIYAAIHLLVPLPLQMLAIGPAAAMAEKCCPKR